MAKNGNGNSYAYGRGYCRADGSGPYTVTNKTGYGVVKDDGKVDEAGNPKERPREVASKIDAASDRGTSNDFIRPIWPGRGLSQDMRFGGGAMTRGVSKPGLKRY
jgi:hypothetical protein